MNTKCWARFRYKQRLQFHPIRIFCLIWIHHFIRNEETQTRTTRAPIIWDVILHSGRAAEQAMLSYIYSQSPMAIAQPSSKNKKKTSQKIRMHQIPSLVSPASSPQLVLHTFYNAFLSPKNCHTTHMAFAAFSILFCCVFFVFISSVFIP